MTSEQAQVRAQIPPPTSEALPHGLMAGASAAAVTVPHAIGLGLLAFAPLAGQYAPSALALWSAALPGALLALVARAPGVIYAPTTVIALLFGGILSTVMQAAPALGMDAAQAMAVTSAVMMLSLGLQWTIGWLRLASLSRFLPVPVTQGFAAGVGLSMILSQFSSGFGAGAWGPMLPWHALIALAVVGLGWGIGRHWPRSPALLLAVAAVAVLAWWIGLGGVLRPAAGAAPFMMPPLPDWFGVPWLAVGRQMGLKLFSLAMLAAVVNSLDVLVFHQELDAVHGLRNDPNAVLRRESLVGMVCAAMGLIPASTSASRSRTALQQAGGPTPAGLWHGVLLIGVALTGHLWLPWLPMACLAGALLSTGARQIPRSMLTLDYARRARRAMAQSWLVAAVFAGTGGASALMAGLFVATLSLLQTSASSAIRRSYLDGEVRSRRLWRQRADAWITPRMAQVAVFELQGIVSFGVASHVCEQVRNQLLPRHRRVVVDASRVPAWDETGYSQFRSLARDLAAQGIPLVLSAVAARNMDGLAGLRVFPDLDRALEWAEEALLDVRPAEDRAPDADHALLGELGDGLSDAGRQALEGRLVAYAVPPDTVIFSAGEHDRDLIFLHEGRVNVATAAHSDLGVRLAAFGRGMVFGEMAFLNGSVRTAFALTQTLPARLSRLSRPDFDQWATDYPDQALLFMSNLAQVGARRLGLTARQLRLGLE